MDQITRLRIAIEILRRLNDRLEHKVKALIAADIVPEADCVRKKTHEKCDVGR